MVVKKGVNNLKEKCVFCDIKSQRDLTLWEWKYWYIKYAKFPYLWLDKHIMAIPKLHKKFSHELSNHEYSEMRELQLFVKSFFKSQEYFSFTRESMWKRSVEHLHIHFLPWVIRASRVEKMLKEQNL